MVTLNRWWLWTVAAVCASSWGAASEPLNQRVPAPLKARIRQVVGCDLPHGRASFDYSAVVGNKLYQARLDTAAGESPAQMPFDGMVAGTVDGDVLRVTAVTPGVAPRPALSIGGKSLLVIFVSFADLPYDPAARQAFESALPKLASFVEQSSRGTVSLTWATVPEALTIGLKAADNPGWAQIATAASAALLVANPQAPAYDHYMYAFPYVRQFAFAGLGEMNGQNTWINGNWGWGVLAHELGHNLGLAHAHSWQPSTTNPLGPGSGSEYGDPYDLMGNAFGATDYNAAYKAQLGWLRPEEVLQVTAPGVVPLNRQSLSGNGGIELMTIGYGTSKYFAVEYWPEVSFAGEPEGVQVRWGSRNAMGEATVETWLLDMTPLAAGGAHDRLLTPGAQLVDGGQGITLSVQAPVGAAPFDSLSVQVDCPVLAPRLQITSPRSGQVVMVNEPAVVTSSARFNPQNIVEAELLADGRVVAVSFSPPFDLTWTPASLRVGTLKVRTRDTFGQTSDSNPVSIIVNWRPQTNVWTLRGVSLSQLTPGDGSWLAIANGQLARSADLVSWQLVTVDPAVAGTPRAVARGGSGLVAVGSDGLIVSSADGSSWASQTVGSGNWNAVKAFGAGWVAVGDGGQIAISADGAAWAVNTVLTGDDLVGLAASAGGLVAIGAKGHVVDLSGATKFFGGAGQRGPMATGGAVGLSAASAPSVNWPGQSLGQNVTCQEITWDGKSFWILGSAGGERRLFGSTDGRTWSGTKVASTRDSALGVLTTVSGGLLIGAGDYIDYRLPGGVWRQLGPAPARFQEAIQQGNDLILLARSDTGTTLESLSLPVSSYDQWVASLPSGASPDFSEYALGKTGGALQISMAGPDQALLGINSMLRPDVRYIVEQSADLAVWNYAFDLPGAFAPRGPRGFFRLQLERTPLW